ncbi:MAG: response regulator [Nanoarchaeota archaeon]
METKPLIILIGDDEEFIRLSIRRLARHDEVHEACTGEELVEKAKRAVETNKPYSYILTDNKYGPGIEGIEAIRQIRDFDKTTPIFWHSGDVDENEGQRDKKIIAALSAGATHAMFKDYNNFSKFMQEQEAKLNQKVGAQ